MTDPNIWSPDSSDQLIRDTLEFMKGTSLTSVTIVSSGSVTFTVETERYFYEGNFILAVNADDITEWMIGQVTSYDALTGELVLVIKTSNGSGTIANWLIYLNAAWKELQFTGGTVSAPITFDDTVDINAALTVVANASITGGITHVGNTTQTGNLTVTGTISSTAGDVNTLAYEVLADADATLTAAQIFNGILYINPTVARTLTMPTAASILSLLTGEAVGSHFQFTIINNSNYQVTLAGNTDITTVGKLTVINGSITFKCRVEAAGVVRVANIARGSKELIADNSTDVTVITSGVDISLISSSARLQHITMSIDGNNVKMPDAMTMYTGIPTFVIYNAGSHPFGIKDYTGTLLTVVVGGGSITMSLASNSTQAGTWAYTGEMLTGGHLVASSSFAAPSTLNRNYQDFVNLDADKSLHFFYGSASDLRVVAYDAVTKTFGTEVLITGTQVDIMAVFKITATTAIIFYTEATATLRAVVITLSGSTTLAVGTEASVTASTGIGIADNQGAPKIAQLDSDLYLIAYANTGANTSVRGIKVHTANQVAIGSAVVVTNNAGLNSTAAYKLSTTVALVLYKKGAGAPYTNYGVTVSVTNANPPVCTVNTSYAATNCASSNLNAPASVLLSTSSVLILDDNNVSGSLVAQNFSISGTVLTAGTAVTVDTSQGTNHSYEDNIASKYNPHLFRLSDTTALCWYRNIAGGPSGLSGLKVLTNTAGVMSAGTKVGGSIGTNDNTGQDGFGIMLAQGITEFVGLIQYTTNNEIIAVPHKISGDTITVGKTKKLGLKINSLATDLVWGKTSSGIYFVTSRVLEPLSGGCASLVVFKCDGDNIYDYFELPKLSATGADSTLMYAASNGDRAILMERTDVSSANVTKNQVSCFELAQ